MLRFSCAVRHVCRQFQTAKVVIQDTKTSYIIQGKRKDKKGNDIKGMKSQKIELRSKNDRIYL